uniref:Uncharacterized protein n=1 Tax=Oryza meridionalis TaxID=40149 RepID=A0A0E0EH07_9ORYZ
MNPLLQLRFANLLDWTQGSSLSVLRIQENPLRSQICLLRCCPKHVAFTPRCLLLLPPLLPSSKSQHEQLPLKIRPLADRLNFPAEQLGSSTMKQRFNLIEVTDLAVVSQGAATKDLRILKSGRRQLKGSFDVDDSQWKEVKANRWRKRPALSPEDTNQLQLQLRRARFLKHMEGDVDHVDLLKTVEEYVYKVKRGGHKT